MSLNPWVLFQLCMVYFPNYLTYHKVTILLLYCKTQEVLTWFFNVHKKVLIVMADFFWSKNSQQPVILI